MESGLLMDCRITRRIGSEDAGMAQRFVLADREQEFLPAPSLRDWLPAGHLAWFVIEAVDQLEFSVFYGVYREDGQGRPAHDPGVVVH